MLIKPFTIGTWPFPVCLHPLFPNVNKAQNSGNPVPVSSLRSPHVAAPLCAGSCTKHTGRNTGAEISANASHFGNHVSLERLQGLLHPCLQGPETLSEWLRWLTPGGRIVTQIQGGMKSPSHRACSKPCLRGEFGCAVPCPPEGS